MHARTNIINDVIIGDIIGEVRDKSSQPWRIMMLKVKQ